MALNWQTDSHWEGFFFWGVWQFWRSGDLGTMDSKPGTPLIVTSFSLVNDLTKIQVIENSSVDQKRWSMCN